MSKGIALTFKKTYRRIHELYTNLHSPHSNVDVHGYPSLDIHVVIIVRVLQGFSSSFQVAVSIVYQLV